jgi:hypothetical protein
MMDLLLSPPVQTAKISPSCDPWGVLRKIRYLSRPEFPALKLSGGSGARTILAFE